MVYYFWLFHIFLFVLLLVRYAMRTKWTKIPNSFNVLTIWIGFREIAVDGCGEDALTTSFVSTYQNRLSAAVWLDVLLVVCPIVIHTNIWNDTSEKTCIDYENKYKLLNSNHYAYIYYIYYKRHAISWMRTLVENLCFSWRLLSQWVRNESSN